MRKFFAFIVISLFFNNLEAQNQKKYALEVSGNFEISKHTSLNHFNKVLGEHHYPNLSNEVLFGGQTNLAFRINRWGILVNSAYYGIHTPKNQNRHYYRGQTEVFSLGVSYDIIQKRWFSLSPYITLGTKSAEIYLDYELKKGVTPTALRITNQESILNTGIRSYFRVSNLLQERWQIFINAEVFYTEASSGILRFNNKLVSENGNFSSVGMLAGVTFRYRF